MSLEFDDAGLAPSTKPVIDDQTEIHNKSNLPIPVRKPLSKSAVIGISVGAAILILLIVALLLYFLVFEKKNNGMNKFGVLTVVNSTNGVSSEDYAPGMTLSATYTPSNNGFGGRSSWTVSINGTVTKLSEPQFPKFR